MNLAELIYRTGQRIQTSTLKKEMGLRASAIPYTSMANILPLANYPWEITTHFDILGIPVDPAAISNWSFDILTNKSFPAKYAKEINIRTDEHGSAKHVWEVNRMLFLPRWALLYKNTGDARYLAVIIRLITSWVEQNPYLTGINWYSNIEINIRLINWFLTWEILQVEEIAGKDEFFKRFVDETWIPSIYQHCKFSYAHPSLHSSANNHLIAEYAGLFIASGKWIFNDSSRWNQYAKQGLEREIILQHSENGINKEEAAEYIQFIADFLLLSMLAGEYTHNDFSPAYKDKFKAVLNYIREFLTIKGAFPKYGDEDDGRVFVLNKDIHDNNFISLLQSGAIYFNDLSLLTDEVVPDQKNLLLFGEVAVARLAGVKSEKSFRISKFYPQEGHFIFRKQGAQEKEIYCHFDAAPLGYLSIAAHGHADALSFVLYLDGEPFFIDPGTYCYHTDAAWRRYFVSTRAHNTICVSGLSQAAFIGPTLWLAHYKTTVKDCHISADYEYVIARHNGYKKYKVDHTRKLEFFKQEERIVITDYITNVAAQKSMIEVLFHLHPNIEYSISDNQAIVSCGNRKVIMALDRQLQWSVVKGQSNPCLGWYSDAFYKKSPSPVIVGALQGNKSLVLRTELLIQ